VDYPVKLTLKHAGFNPVEYNEHVDVENFLGIHILELRLAWLEMCQINNTTRRIARVVLFVEFLHSCSFVSSV